MKRLALALMAIGMFSAVPVLAAEHEGMKMETKDGMRECAVQAETIQQKITRIQKSIDEGSKKYTAKELQKLKAKLQDANNFLDKMDKQ